LQHKSRNHALAGLIVFAPAFYGLTKA